MARRSTPRALAATGAAVLAVALSGCARGSAPGFPPASALPLAPGARLVADMRRCDAGADAFCGRELVLAGRPGRYRGSAALLAAERRRLRTAGWSESRGDTDYETAAESPANRLRLVYATAADELISLHVGTISRAPRITRALSALTSAGRPALSLEVQAGSASP